MIPDPPPPPPPPGPGETGPGETGPGARDPISIPPGTRPVPLEPTEPAVSSLGGPIVPAIVDDRDHALDPRALSLSRIGSFIAAAIFSGLVLIGAVVVIFATPVRWPWALGAWLLWTLLLAIRAWFWPALVYRHTSYRLSPRGLVIRRGVLWRSVAHVPRSRVQHTDVSQGPLERYFELGTLTVHTAGTQFASVSLGGLAHRTAESIRDVLIDGGEEDGV